MHINEHSFRVRYIETDKMGIVYHANYYVWFDIGRTEFIRSIGLNYSELEDKGLLLPILETHCIYRKAARYDELVTVRTSLSELKGVRIIFKYEVYNEEKELLVYGSTVQAFVDRNLKPINAKKAFPDIYRKLESCIIYEM
jgi:acyl-CoA thioester hydrolase